jgi:hypothetical protein
MEMPEVTVNLTLRPIKFAFLLDAEDKASLLKIIEINSFLWGGIYNPIIPTFVPERWKDSANTPSPSDLVSELLETYDPDIVVVGSGHEHRLSIGNRQSILLSEVLTGVEEHGTGSYGISVFELLNHFIDTEMKFIRREPLNFCLTQFGNPSDVFWASVFGTLPRKIHDLVLENYAPFIDQQIDSLPVSQYLELFKPNTLFLRRLTSLYVEAQRMRLWGGDECIFLLDPDATLDSLNIGTSVLSGGE